MLIPVSLGTASSAPSPRMGGGERVGVTGSSHVLVVRFGAIGDALRVLPAVRRLHVAKPDVSIGWAVEQWVLPVLAGNPNVDRFHVLDRRELRAGPVRALREVARLRREIRSVGYDTVLDFHGRFKSGVASFLSGAATRIGYARGDSTEGNHLFNNVHVHLDDRWENRVLRFLHLLEPLGIDTSFDESDVGIHVPDEQREWARSSYERCGQPTIAAYPGTSSKRAQERWPLEKWIELLRRLGEEGLQSILFWGPDEKDLCARLREAAGPACVLAPPTTLPQMMAMIACCGVFIGSDTAAMHMAWLQGVPTAVFTSLKPAKTFAPLPPCPYRVLRVRDREREDLPVHKQPGGVLSEVAVSDAIDAVRALLSTPRGGFV
jgi:ADP-heptose:LPS heptosyltransferase